MNVGFVLGLVGDGLSFAGAAWLVRNEFKRESEYKEEEQMAGLIRDLPGINFESTDGQELASRMDVRLSLLRSAGRRSHRVPPPFPRLFISDYFPFRRLSSMRPSTMQELFRLRISADHKTTIPQRLLNILKLKEGDELRISTMDGRIITTEAHQWDSSPVMTPAETEAILAKIRELRSGPHEEYTDLAALFGPSTEAAGLS